MKIESVNFIQGIFNQGIKLDDNSLATKLRSTIAILKKWRFLRKFFDILYFSNPRKFDAFLLELMLDRYFFTLLI